MLKKSFHVNKHVNIRLWIYVVIKTTQPTVSLIKTWNLNIVESFHVTAVSKMSSFIVIFIFFTTISELQSPLKWPNLMHTNKLIKCPGRFSVIRKLLFCCFYIPSCPLVLNYDAWGQNVPPSLLLVNQTPFKKWMFYGRGLFFMVKTVVLTLQWLFFHWFRSTDTIGLCHFLCNIIN